MAALAEGLGLEFSMAGFPVGLVLYFLWMGRTDY